MFERQSTGADGTDGLTGTEATSSVQPRSKGKVLIVTKRTDTGRPGKAHSMEVPGKVGSRAGVPGTAHGTEASINVGDSCCT